MAQPIGRAEWERLDKGSRTIRLTSMRDEALENIVAFARERGVIPVGEPRVAVVYTQTMAPPVKDLGPNDPTWLYVSVVALASTMGAVH